MAKRTGNAKSSTVNARGKGKKPSCAAKRSKTPDPVASLPAVKKAKKLGPAHKNDFLVCSQCGSWKLSLCHTTPVADDTKNKAASRVEKRVHCVDGNQRHRASCRGRKRRHSHHQSASKCRHTNQHSRSHRSRTPHSTGGCTKHSCYSNISFDSASTDVSSEQSGWSQSESVISFADAVEQVAKPTQKPATKLVKKPASRKAKPLKRKAPAPQPTPSKASKSSEPKRKQAKPKKETQVKAKDKSKTALKPRAHVVKKPALDSGDVSVDFFGLFSQNTARLHVSKSKVQTVKKFKEERKKTYQTRARSRKHMKLELVQETKPMVPETRGISHPMLVDKATATFPRRPSSEIGPMALKEHSQLSSLVPISAATIAGVSPSPRPPTPIALPSNPHEFPPVMVAEPQDAMARNCSVGSLNDIANCESHGSAKARRSPRLTKSTECAPVVESMEVLNCTSQASVQARRSPRLAKSAESNSVDNISNSRSSKSNEGQHGHSDHHQPSEYPSPPQLVASLSVSPTIGNNRTKLRHTPEATYIGDLRLQSPRQLPQNNIESEGMGSLSSSTPSTINSECIDAEKDSLSNDADNAAASSSTGSRSCPGSPVMTSPLQRRGYCSESPKFVFGMH